MTDDKPYTPRQEADALGWMARRYLRLSLAGRSWLAEWTRAQNPKLEVTDADLAHQIEVFRSALMVAHQHDWPMETIAEAAHICAQAWAAQAIAQPATKARDGAS